MTRPITAADLADALGYFSNTVLGAMHHGTATEACIAQGIDAVSGRLAELATKPEPDIYEHLAWAVSMAEEAILGREAGDDPDDTPEIIAMHRQALVKTEAVLAARPKASGLETPRMLVLNTGHITKVTMLRLQNIWRNELPIFYPTGEYGWIIPIQTGSAEERWGYCPDLFAIRALAEANGCTWIMLDRDADVVADLPTYEW